jgi:hypothetical protein
MAGIVGTKISGEGVDATRWAMAVASLPRPKAKDIQQKVLRDDDDAMPTS